MRLRRIGVFIHPWHAAFREMLAGIAGFAANRPDWLLYFPWPGRADWSRPPEQPLDAAIIRLGAGLDCPATVCRDLPRVVIGRASQSSVPGNVDWDNRRVGALGAEHLMEQGLIRFAFIRDEEDFYAVERWKGFEETLRKKRRHAELLVVGEDESPSELAKWLRTLTPPVGIMGATDRAAVLALSAAQIGGRRVPEEFVVVGAGDDELICSLCHPPLSSVILPGRVAGRVAAEMLDRILSGVQVGSSTRLVTPTHVAARRSSDLLAIDDLLVARVLKLIRRDATGEITFESLRSAVPLSKRSLEIRFKAVVGRTIEQEIARVRCEHAKVLLSTTDLPLEDVAAQSGFSSARRMSIVFSQLVKAAPSGYRRSMQLAT